MSGVEFEGSLDDLHRAMDRLTEEIHNPDLWPKGDETVSLYSFSELSDLLPMLDSWSTYIDALPKLLGVNASLLKRFINGRSEIPVRDAKRIAERTLILLKSIEGDVAAREQPLAPPDTTPTPPSVSLTATGITTGAPTVGSPTLTTTPAPQTERFSADSWALVPPTQNVKRMIAYVSEVLDQVLALAKGGNLPEGQAALTDIERKSLIAVLETALQVLKAPMVERGLFKKLLSSLGNVSKKVAEKEVEEGLGKLADAARDAIEVAIKEIF